MTDFAGRLWLRPSEQCVEHGEEHPSLVGAFTDIGLDADQLASRFREQLETRIERDLLGLVQHELEPFCQMTLPGQIQTSSTLIRAIEDAVDHALGISGRKSPSGHSHGIKSAADCLVDALGDMRGFLRARYGDKVRLKLVAPQRGLLGRRIGLIGSQLFTGRQDDAADLAASAAMGLADAAEQRALWARFGL